jgi:hypothetical protein
MAAVQLIDIVSGYVLAGASFGWMALFLLIHLSIKLGKLYKRVKNLEEKNDPDSKG